MRRLIVSAAFATLLGGCGSPEDRDSDVAVAVPPADLMVTAVPSGASAAAPEPADDQATIDDVSDAGALMMTARNVCRLSKPELAKFAVYSEWIVNRDAQRKAIFLEAANQAMTLQQDLARQGRLEAYRRKTCPQVQRVLAVIEQDFKRKPVRHAAAGAAR